MQSPISAIYGRADERRRLLRRLIVGSCLLGRNLVLVWINHHRKLPLQALAQQFQIYRPVKPLMMFAVKQRTHDWLNSTPSPPLRPTNKNSVAVMNSTVLLQMCRNVLLLSATQNNPCFMSFVYGWSWLDSLQHPYAHFLGFFYSLCYTSNDLHPNNSNYSNLFLFMGSVSTIKDSRTNCASSFGQPEASVSSISVRCQD